MSRTRRTDLPETNWATRTLCADMPAEIFDATGDRVQTAKAACAHCPVTRQCLRWAISHEVEDEIDASVTVKPPPAFARGLGAPIPVVAPVGLKSGP